MKKKIRKKNYFNKSDTETNKVKWILKKGWFVTEWKNEASTAKQAIPDFAAVCRDSFTVYNGLHINMSQCNALVQK